MDRLTGKAIVGWTPRFAETIYGNLEKATQCYNRLVDYEDTGLAPDEIKSLIHDAGINIAMRNRELKAENAHLRAKLETAIKDMQIMHDALENESCETCTHSFAGEPGETICLECNDPESMWEWRGLEKPLSEDNS